jgi:outer membrane protein assembly factor BamB
MRGTFLACVVAVFAAVSASPLLSSAEAGAGGSTPAETARELLERSGLQGGLVVHVGCGDGQVTAALRASDRYLVHGLETDAAQRDQARRHIHAQGLYGTVAVADWDGTRLPYAENLVNLLIVQRPDEVELDEALRVLAPSGVALVNRDGQWEKTVKPWPDEIDQWTHYLHNPSNNAVADDAVVGPPRRLQWLSGPAWARSHEHLATLSAAVSANGRLFSIIDKGPTFDVTMPPEWTLVARDAFSGVLLWQRPMGTWEWRLRGFRSGPPELARRLVAVDDRVYVTLGYGQGVVALDGASGQALREYDQTVNTQEILLLDGVLYLVVGEAAPDPAVQARRAARTDQQWNWWPIYEQPRPKTRLLAVDVETGRTLWSNTESETERVMPTTLAVADGRVFFQSPRYVVCLDAETGRETWRADRPVNRRRPAWSTPTLVVYDGVVLSADRAVPEAGPGAEESEVVWTVTSQGGISPPGQLIAFSAETGERLWTAPCREGYNTPVDVLVAGGLVWTGDLVGAKDPGILEGRDLRTGQVRRRRDRDQQFYQPIMSHARCHRHKATHRYLITGRSGVEFADIETGEALAHHWVRGECQYGVIPCNGLLYVPPHPCACFILAKLNSFHVLASHPVPQDGNVATTNRLEPGPAFQAIEPQEQSPGDWPTYRYGPERGGATPAVVAAGLRPAWQTQLQAPLTAPVAAGGRVYVASADTHTLHVLDENNGQPIWQFTAGGRIDSPPTVWSGRVLMGSADGWIYCLRARDGALAWRYRAAPKERLVTVHGQLESAWPVHGSVLVLPASDSSPAVVYASAGRSGYLDGGIVLVRLDAASGQELSRTVIDSRDPETGQQPHPLPRPAPGFSMSGALSDILSAQQDSVFMRHLRFTLDGSPAEKTIPHLHSPAGFLDDSWWHRTYWIVGSEMHGGWGSWPNMGMQVPSGRLLVLDGQTVYGFGRDRYHRDGSHVGLGGANYRLFARELDTAARRTGEDEVFLWQQPVEPVVRAMTLAGETLFIAGPGNPLAAEEPTAVWKGEAGGLLWAVSARDGQRLAAYPLDAPPVFDGLIATAGRVLYSATDGRMVCFAESEN